MRACSAKPTKVVPTTNTFTRAFVSTSKSESRLAMLVDSAPIRRGFEISNAVGLSEVESFGVRFTSER
jgi:hypothetical protein